MQITLTAEQEAQLQKIASVEDRPTEELAVEVFSRGLAEEAHFLASVRIGQEAARRGDFIEPSEVWAGIERILQA